jgi:hypothetical protein
VHEAALVKVCFKTAYRPSGAGGLSKFEAAVFLYLYLYFVFLYFVSGHQTKILERLCLNQSCHQLHHLLLAL